MHFPCTAGVIEPGAPVPEKRTTSKPRPKSRCLLGKESIRRVSNQFSFPPGSSTRQSTHAGGQSARRLRSMCPAYRCSSGYRFIFAVASTRAETGWSSEISLGNIRNLVVSCAVYWRAFLYGVRFSGDVVWDERGGPEHPILMGIGVYWRAVLAGLWVSAAGEEGSAIMETSSLIRPNYDARPWLAHAAIALQLVNQIMLAARNIRVSPVPNVFAFHLNLNR